MCFKVYKWEESGEGQVMAWYIIDSGARSLISRSIGLWLGRHSCQQRNSARCTAHPAARGLCCSCWNHKLLESLALLAPARPVTDFAGLFSASRATPPSHPDGWGQQWPKQHKELPKSLSRSSGEFPTQAQRGFPVMSRKNPLA